MALKTDRASRSPDVMHWDGGLSWIAHPEETMLRASHVLSVQDQLWVVDPLDAEGVDAHLRKFGTVAGVVSLMDRHLRDSIEFASRHEVPLYVPEPMASQLQRESVEVKPLGAQLGETTYRPIPIVESRFWQEVMLVDDRGTIVVPEAVGTAPYYRAGRARLGVHPMLRLRPPRRAFKDRHPSRLLVGHGYPVLRGADSALSAALTDARRGAPRAYANAIRSVFP